MSLFALEASVARSDRLAVTSKASEEVENEGLPPRHAFASDLGRLLSSFTPHRLSHTR